MTLKMPILGPPLADTMLTFSWAPPLADSQRPSKKCRTARILATLEKIFEPHSIKLSKPPIKEISLTKVFLDIKSFF